MSTSPGGHLCACACIHVSVDMRGAEGCRLFTDAAVYLCACLCPCVLRSLLPEVLEVGLMWTAKLSGFWCEWLRAF